MIGTIDNILCWFFGVMTMLIFSGVVLVVFVGGIVEMLDRGNHERREDLTAKNAKNAERLQRIERMYANKMCGLNNNDRNAEREG